MILRKDNKMIRVSEIVHKWIVSKLSYKETPNDLLERFMHRDLAKKKREKKDGNDKS